MKRSHREDRTGWASSKRTKEGDDEHKTIQTSTSNNPSVTSDNSTKQLTTENTAAASIQESTPSASADFSNTTFALLFQQLQQQELIRRQATEISNTNRVDVANASMRQGPQSVLLRSIANDSLPPLVTSQNQQPLNAINSVVAQTQILQLLSALQGNAPALASSLPINPQASLGMNMLLNRQNYHQQNVAEYRSVGLQASTTRHAPQNPESLAILASHTPRAPINTGISLSMSTDAENLSEYQTLMREQIEIFEATKDDVEASAQGRNKPITEDQVGIRCRRCAYLSPGRRPRGAVYFPSKLSGVYQACQNMMINHFTDSCQNLPPPIRARLLALKEQRTTVLGGGKQYWANAARVLGLYETPHGLRLRKSGDGTS